MRQAYYTSKGQKHASTGSPVGETQTGPVCGTQMSVQHTRDATFFFFMFLIEQNDSRLLARDTAKLPPPSKHVTQLRLETKISNQGRTYIYINYGWTKQRPPPS